MKPAEGERRAAAGYNPQYKISAKMILQKLKQGNLEWIRVADPDAGRVDDCQIGTTARIDAYQVKWSQYPGATTLNDLIKGSKEEASLISQLADGWKTLRSIYPQRRVVVHLITNTYPSSSTSASMPQTNSPPTPYHLAAFIEQAWNPAHQEENYEFGSWEAVWKLLIQESGLSDNEFSKFVRDCFFDFKSVLPNEELDDIQSIANLLFDIAAGADKRIEISQNELLQRLGWQSRYTYRNIHEFPAPLFLYRPIEKTVEEIKTALDSLPGGYFGVFGSPGSGKSTLLTQTLRALPIRLVRYYAYVPDTQDLSILRGESVNFLQDVTLRLSEAGFCKVNRPDASDRSALLKLLHQQLQELGDDYQQTGTKTIILIDGLDHIAREQNPDRSLLQDFPLPQAVPDGVYFLIGSQPNGLTNLPPLVSQALHSQGRKIEIAPLAPADVFLIAKQEFPDLEDDEQKQIYTLSGGHPLALIYLIKQLQQANNPQDRTRLIEEKIPYANNIDEQYLSHWNRIKDDENLLHILGLISRIRGVIPLNLVANWTDNTTLRKLQQLFFTYFQEENKDYCVFFHNSFRLFLQERTAEPLFGKTREQQDRDYHQELAQLYSNSPAPWQWEILYHLYKANDYAAVVKLANQTWFRKQVEHLRPRQAIWTDIRLAFKAAGELQDVIALLELTLAGGAIDQRMNDIDEFPHLLLKVGKLTETVEHLRDGNHLRASPELALRLSIQLHHAGLVNEGRRIFELAEPLELLSGRVIDQNNNYDYAPKHLYDLLSDWVGAALFFRDREEVVEVIKRIRIKPDQAYTADNVSEAEHSLDLQNWLLFQGILVCCERNNREGWQIIFDIFIEQSDRSSLFFALLRSAEICQEIDEIDWAKTLLDQLLEEFQPQELNTLGENIQITKVRLNLAELIIKISDDKALARLWIEGLTPIPLKDGSTETVYHRLQDYKLQFKYGRLVYLLGKDPEPEFLRDEAVKVTEFLSHVNEKKKQSYCVIALAVFSLARLQAWAYSDFYLEPIPFIRKVKWILDLIGPRYLKLAKYSSLEFRKSRSWFLNIIIDTAALHGELVIRELAHNLELRWTNEREKNLWSVDLQRNAVVALSKCGVSHDWSKAQLNRIEPVMLNDLDPQGRASACKEQAEAWLILDDKDKAAQELSRMMKAARGIYSDKDYQLEIWIDWFARVTEHEPEKFQERLILMLKRLLSVNGNASGVIDAAYKLLEIMFQQSPRKAVLLLKGLLELDVIGYQGSIVSLLREALKVEKPPLQEIIHTIENLVLPFMTGEESNLIEPLIIKTRDCLGSETALDCACHLVSRIRIDMLSSYRSSWHRAVAHGVKTIGFTPAKVGLQPEDLEESNKAYESRDLDRKLYLKNGDCLEPDAVSSRILSISDFRTLIEEEDQDNTHYFSWESVVESLGQKLVSSTELRELESIVKSKFSSGWSDRYSLAKILLTISKKAKSLGDSSFAWKIADEALHTTDGSAWDSYFDGGTRHEILRHLIAIDADRGRKTAIKLYAEEASQGQVNSYQTTHNLDEILEVLFDEIPVTKIWGVIEDYLDELFAGVPLEPELPSQIQEALQLDTGEEDTPARAIADFLSLHLDHPSYPVAQGAVRAFTFSLLEGKTAVILALIEALNRTEQSAERALMVLDAASKYNTKSIEPFEEILKQLRCSPNFLIRLIASCVWANYQDEELLLQTVEREIPTVYSFELPSISLHRTEKVAGREDITRALIEDPARKLRPLDIEAREIANIARISEDNVFYQAIHYFQKLITKRSWLSEDPELKQEKISRFLENIGLMHSFQKPHISIARQALSYVAADLFDAGYFTISSLRRLWCVLVYHDSDFILNSPSYRPSCISTIGGIPAKDSSFISLPDDWIESAETSLPLLNLQTVDKQIILGEWTRLRYLNDQSPAEERISFIRATNPENLWHEFKIEKGHRPFSQFVKCQTAEYLHLKESLDHLIIAGDGYSFDTPGNFWLALNPSLASVLNWSPIDGHWFGWVNQTGDLVVESIWWHDGPLHQYSARYLNCEVGSGWQVLVTEQGFEEIKQFGGQLSRGGLVRRQLGFYGRDGDEYSTGILTLTSN
jgi:hypothetical protein